MEFGPSIIRSQNAICEWMPELGTITNRVSVRCIELLPVNDACVVAMLLDFTAMAGVLRATVKLQAPVQSPLICSVRGLRTHARPLRKDAKPAEPIKGIPYKNLSIGVPKEIWTNERRYANKKEF